MPQADRKPNWKVWAHVPGVRAWEAIALSLDIDPKKVKVQAHAWMGYRNRFPHEEGQQFEDRIEVLRRNLGQDKGLPLASVVMGRPDYCEIYVADFTLWAMLLHWDMPTEMKALAASRPPPKSLPPERLSNSFSNKKSALSVPEKLTLAWMWNHVPVSWWWWLGGIVVAAFVSGLTVGRSDFYSRLSNPLPAASAPPTSPAGEPTKRAVPGQAATTLPLPPKSGGGVPK